MKNILEYILLKKGIIKTIFNYTKISLTIEIDKYKVCKP